MTKFRMMLAGSTAGVFAVAAAPSFAQGLEEIGVRNDRVSISAYVNNLTQNNKLASALGGTFDVYNFAYSAAPLSLPQVNAIRISFPLKRVFCIRASYNF